MPWTLGSQQTKNNIEAENYRPIADGWAQYIMENILFYIPLSGIFLQRIRTFTYPEKLPAALPSATTPFNHFHHPSSVTMAPAAANNNTMTTTPKPSDQLKITYRFINVFKAEGLIDFLSIVEQSLVRVQSETAHLPPQQPATASYINPQAIDILSTQYFNGQKTYVQQILKKTYDDLIQLDGGTWICPNLFIKNATPRSKPLVEALDALAQACIPQQDTSITTARPTWGVGSSLSATKSTQYIKELQEVSKIFASVFSVKYRNIISIQCFSLLFFSTQIILTICISLFIAPKASFKKADQYSKIHLFFFSAKDSKSIYFFVGILYNNDCEKRTDSYGWS